MYLIEYFLHISRSVKITLRQCIEVRYHHIREFVTDKKLEVRKVDIEVNIADSLTKPLPYHRFGMLRRQMALFQAENQRRAKSGVLGSQKSEFVDEPEWQSQ